MHPSSRQSCCPSTLAIAKKQCASFSVRLRSSVPESLSRRAYCVLPINACLLAARARAASPCLLFFDEFDAIAHKRSFGEHDGGSSGGGVYARVLSTFLNEMDGVGSQRITVSTSHAKNSSTARSCNILVVAATNRKDALDAALIRPGRIDKTVELGYPTQEDIEVRSTSASD